VGVDSGRNFFPEVILQLFMEHIYITFISPVPLGVLGGTRDPSAPSLSDAALIDAAARDLESEGLVRGDPDPVRVTRWERAIPQYERGHAGRMEVLADTERRMPGLLFAGNYRGGVSVADVIRSGLAAGAGP